MRSQLIAFVVGHKKVLAVLAAGVAFGCMITLTPWHRLNNAVRSFAGTLAEPAPRGFLYVEAPQVFTRERLVNDRFREAQWLTEEINYTARPEDAARFGVASRRETTVRSEETSAAAQISGGKDPANSNASRNQGDSSSSGGAKRVLDETAKANVGQIALDPLNVIERRTVYRDRLRTALMDTLLDDGHDLDGNTLYRLNFDATAMPWRGTRSEPLSAVFIVKVAKPVDIEKGEAALRQSNDDLELLRDLQGQMQNLVSRVVKFRVESLASEGRLINPHNSREQIVFQDLLVNRLIEDYINILVDAAWVCEEDTKNRTPTNKCKRYVEYDGKLCAEELAGKEFRKHVTELAQIKFDKDKFKPNQIQKEKFRKFLEMADKINEAFRRLEAMHEPSCKGKGQTATEPRPVQCGGLEMDETGQRAILRLINVIDRMRRDLPKEYDLNFSGNDEWPIEIFGKKEKISSGGK